MSVQIKGSGTIGGLDEGLVVSGIVTSSTQINVGSNIKLGSAGVVTATSLDISGDIDVDGHTNLDNVSIVGVTTFNGLSTNDVIRVRAADTNGISVINILAEGTTGHSRIKFSDTAGTDGQISYTHTDRALTFAAGGTTERLRISSEGYVTKPAHPCFDVVRSGGNVSSGNYIIYNTVNVNNGAHYNASTGKFTAPVAGHYFFSYGTIKNTSSVTRLYFRKNQSNFPTGADRHLRMDSGQGGYGDNGAMTIVVNLAVGDEIQIYVGAGEAYGATQEYCYFNGFLLG